MNHTEQVSKVSNLSFPVFPHRMMREPRPSYTFYRDNLGYLCSSSSSMKFFHALRHARTLILTSNPVRCGSSVPTCALRILRCLCRRQESRVRCLSCVHRTKYAPLGMKAPYNVVRFDVKTAPRPPTLLPSESFLFDAELSLKFSGDSSLCEHDVSQRGEDDQKV